MKISLIQWSTLFRCCLWQPWLNLLNTQCGTFTYSFHKRIFNRDNVAFPWFMKIQTQSETLQHLHIDRCHEATPRTPPPLPKVLYCHSLPVQPKQTTEREKRPASSELGRYRRFRRDPAKEECWYCSSLVTTTRITTPFLYSRIANLFLWWREIRNLKFTAGTKKIDCMKIWKLK